MPSRSISIKEEIYNQLSKYRLKNESFSGAIKRLIKSNADILDFSLFLRNNSKHGVSDT